MSIKIGNKNKIKNSSIGHTFNSTNKDYILSSKKSFVTKHPILISFFVSVISGLILLFSFWKDVINWIERLIK
jgi:hypothetical protein